MKYLLALVLALSTVLTHAKGSSHAAERDRRENVAETSVIRPGFCPIKVTEQTVVNGFAVARVVLYYNLETRFTQKHLVCFLHGHGGRYQGDNEACAYFHTGPEAEKWFNYKLGELAACK